MPPSPPPIRVVVRLPYTRPDDAKDPPPIEWNAEKADILWKSIEKSRSSDDKGTDWKALAMRLDVPLPYLLYRVHTRFQEELRGLQGIQGSLSPSIPQPQSPESPLERPGIASRAISGSTRLSSSSRLSTPLGVRARLSSLGHNAHRPKKTTSSSTLTVQGPAPKGRALLQPTTASSSEESDSDGDEADREDEADRAAEEQEALDQKLRDLQKMMSNDALGLVSTPRNQGKGKMKEKELDRGRSELTSSLQNLRRLQPLAHTRSASHSLSTSTESPHGSIPDIPSPPPDSQPHSPISRHLSSSKSTSPPALSPRNALGQSHRRYTALVDHGSNQGSERSEASSFSDISDASLSASALESALMSNIRGNGSRLSAFAARSRFVNRGGPYPL